MRYGERARHRHVGRWSAVIWPHGCGPLGLAARLLLWERAQMAMRAKRDRRAFRKPTHAPAFLADDL